MWLHSNNLSSDLALLLLFNSCALQVDFISAFTTTAETNSLTAAHLPLVSPSSQREVNQGSKERNNKNIIAKALNSITKERTMHSLPSSLQRTGGEIIQGHKMEWLGLLIREVLLGKETSECSLLLALDTTYLASSIMMHLDSLPHLKQIVVVQKADDLLSVVWDGLLCRAYLFLLHNPKPLFSFADRDLRVWDYHGKYIVVGFSIDELDTFTQTKKGKKTQHIVAIVKVATFEFAPDVMYDRRKAGPPRLYGREVEVVRALATACNFTINFVEVPPGEVWGSKLPNGSWSGLIGMLGRGDGDIGIATIYISSLHDRKDYLDFTAPFDQLMNCVLLKVPDPLPRWQAPLWPFKQDTWLAITGGLLLTGPALYCLAKLSFHSHGEAPYLHSLTSSYLYVTAVHLQESTVKHPQAHTIRLSVAFLWLYVMVLGMSYSCNLTAFLTVTRQPHTIDTFRDLHDSDLSIVSMGPFFGNLMERSANYHLRGLHGRFISLRSDPESWVLNGTAGHITSRHTSEFIRTQINSGHITPVVRIMKECTWPFSVGVGLQSYSPLKSTFDLVINMIVESGLVYYWFRESVQLYTQARQMQQRTEFGEEKADQVANKVVPLNTDHTQGIFWVLALCYLATFIVFLAELWLGRQVGCGK